MLEKLKSYKFLMSLFGAIILIVQNATLLFGVKINDEILFNLLNSVAGALVVLGVVKKSDKTEDPDYQEDVLPPNKTKPDDADTQ